MESSLLEEFRKQLPKPTQWSVPNIVQVAGSACSILALVAAIFFFEQDALVTIYNLALIVLVFNLIGFTVIREVTKQHRYSQSVYYNHFANHIVRDYFGKLRRGETSDIRELTKELLTCIADCYTLVTGHPCSASLKELTKDLEIGTSVRCLKSKIKRNLEDTNKSYSLTPKTPYFNLWYAQEGCMRYYHCNDLIYAYRNRKYENHLISSYGEPKIKCFLKVFSFVKGWKLPYRSVIVLPIRNIKRFDPPEVCSNKVTEVWDFWGFLSIDCNWRGVFHPRLSPELGLAFADLFYILFTVANEGLKQKSINEKRPKAAEVIHKELIRSRKGDNECLKMK